MCVNIPWIIIMNEHENTYFPKSKDICKSNQSNNPIWPMSQSYWKEKKQKNSLWLAAFSRFIFKLLTTLTPKTLSAAKHILQMCELQIIKH